MANRSGQLLEREGELSLLEGLFDQLDSSGGQTVLIRGEAGIGKTALVREFMSRCTGRAHILAGACDDLSTRRALGPFWDMARNEPQLLDALEKDGRPAVLDAVLDLSARTLRPTIIFIEDTQWADEATLDVVSFLGRRIGEVNGLLLLTYRDGDIDLDHPLRSVMGGLPTESVVRIRLEGLSRVGVADLIAGSGFDVEEIFAATDGNPFLTIEMASGDHGSVPASVQDSVLSRMRALSPTAQDVLMLLSVVPGTISATEVASLVGDDTQGLTECEQRDFIREAGDSLEFCHDLIRRAVEASMTGAEQVAMNRRVIEKLPLSTDPAKLVHHAHASHDTQRIVELAPLAGEAAFKAGSFREAAAFFRMLTPHTALLAADNKATTLDHWAFTEALESSYHSAMQLTRLSQNHYREIGDQAGESIALANMAYYYAASGHTSLAEQHMNESVAALGSNPVSTDLAQVLEKKAFLALQAGDTATAAYLADRALQAGGAGIDEGLVVRCLVHKGAAADISDYPSGERSLGNAIQRAETGDQWIEVWRAIVNHAESASDNYDAAEATKHAQRAVEVSIDHELGMGVHYAKAVLAEALLLQGEWTRAEELAGEQLERSTRTIVHIVALPVMGTIEVRTGRRSARETLERAWSAATEIQNFQHLAPVAAAIAESVWITGDSADVSVSEIKRVMELGEHRGGTWLSGSIAFWLWTSGDLDEAPDWIAEPFRLMMSGEPLAAAELWAERGCPYEQAMALNQGDTKARLEAVKLLDRLGATAVAGKLRRELRASGISVPRRPAKRDNGAVGLTPRQTEVLSMLNEDLSNAQIADQLFLSPRTVEHHVAAVLSKLDASSRSEAVNKATAQGLLIAVG